MLGESVPNLGCALVFAHLVRPLQRCAQIDFRNRAVQADPNRPGRPTAAGKGVRAQGTSFAFSICPRRDL